MSDAVLVAIISGGVVVIGNVFVVIQTRITSKKLDENTVLTKSTAQKVFDADQKLDGRLTELLRASIAEALAKGTVEGRALGLIEGQARATERAEGRVEGMDTIKRSGEGDAK
jgi:hypothetical protein